MLARGVALLLLCCATWMPAARAQGLVVLLAGEWQADGWLAALAPAQAALERPPGAVPVGALRLVLDEQDASSPRLEDGWEVWRLARSDSRRARGIELLSRIAQAPVICLDGGRFLEWWRMMNQQQHPSRLAQALDSAWRAGACLAGRGGGAAWLAGGSRQERAQLGSHEHNPRKRSELELEVAGAGLVPLHLEVLGLATGGGRAGDGQRLLEAALEAPFDLAVLLCGEVAWVRDPRRAQARVLGTGHALLIDRSRVRVGRFGLRGARLSLLRAEDRWRDRGQLVLPGGATHALESSAALPELFAHGDPADSPAPLEVLLTIDEEARAREAPSGLALYGLRLEIRQPWPGAADPR